MLKHRSKIKKANAQTLGDQFIVEYKVYVPRGQVNTAFFNIYKIVGETESFYKTESVPLVEMQIIRNHLAKARGEDEWTFDFLYNADDDNTWIAFGITDPSKWLRDHSDRFINIIKHREDDYKKKMEARKEKLRLKREEKAKAKNLEKQILENNPEDLDPNNPLLKIV